MGTREEISWHKRGICFLVALVLAWALLPLASPLQRAEAAELGGEATLTIVFGQDFNGSDDVKVNVTLPFSQGATVEDLLDAAVVNGSLGSYSLDSGGFMSSCAQDGVMLTNASNMSTYWAFFIDGTYYAGADSLKTIELVAGSSYQFAWDSYLRTVTPDWSTVEPAEDGTGYVTGGDTAVGTATIVVSMGYESYGGFVTAKPSQWYNANTEYSFAAGATVADLLDAAANNDEYCDYFFEGFSLNAGGHLESVTDMIFGEYKNAEDYSTYWSFYINGAYYSGMDTLNTIALQDGASYQFAWSSYPSAIPPDTTTFNGHSALAYTGTAIAGVSKPIDASPINPAEADQLLNTIAVSLVGTGDPWEAMSLGALGLDMPASVDLQALLTDALAAYNTPNTTNIQRAILALTAVGIDASQVPYPSGSVARASSFDLVDKMLNTPLATATINGQLFALLALAAGPYDAAAGTAEDLVDSIVASQLADGGFAWDTSAGAPVDPDMTAMAITALATQQGNPVADAALQKALVALQLYQLDDGSWGAYDTVVGDVVSNVYSTSMAVIALSSVGIDPATLWVKDGGATPLSALLSFANSAGTAFGSNQMANEQGFRALVSYEGYKHTNKAFNVYTQTLTGIRVPASSASVQNPAAAQGAATLPATGDSSLLLPGVLMLSALCLCATAYRAQRRAQRVGR